MSLKYILSSALIITFSFYSLSGQTVSKNISKEESIIDISPAELQSLVEELMQLKRKRMLYLAALQQQRNASRQSITTDTPTNNNKSTVHQLKPSKEESILNQRVLEMEKLLAEMKQQLNRIEKKEQATVTKNVTSQIEKRDLDQLEKEIKKEVNDLKKTIQKVSTNPPSTTRSVNGRDTIYIQNDTEYLKEYASQMMELREDVRGMEGKLMKTITKANYYGLQKHLDRIEEKIVSPIVIKSDKNNNTNTDQVPQPVSNAVLASQLSDLRKLVKELNTPDENNPVAVIPPPATNNDALIAQFNVKFEELRDMIENIQPDTLIRIQPEIQIIKEKIVTIPAPPVKPSNNTPVVPSTSYNPLEDIVSSNKKQLLFFANNAFETTSTHQMTLEKTIGLLQQYPSLNISINGYSSPKGSAIHNQTLSRKRADMAKNYLIRKGISPNRISTDSQGVDYDSLDAAQARRVELVLLLPR